MPAKEPEPPGSVKAGNLARWDRPRIVGSMRTRTPILLAAASLAATLAACGGAQPPPQPAAAVPKPSASAPPPQPAVPPGHIARMALEDALVQGPPWILRRVAVEEVIRGGNFIGWKIVGLPAEWGEVQVKVGDVVTRVNGQPIEKPDDLFAAWKGLATAKEIKIAVERDGKETEIVFPVVGEPSPVVVKAFEQGGPVPPPAKRQGRPKGVTEIQGDDGGAEGE